MTKDVPHLRSEQTAWRSLGSGFDSSFAIRQLDIALHHLPGSVTVLRQRNGEDRPFASLAGHRDIAAHKLTELAADGEAQARAAILLARRTVRLLEGLQSVCRTLVWSVCMRPRSAG